MDTNTASDRLGRILDEVEREMAVPDPPSAAAGASAGASAGVPSGTAAGLGSLLGGLSGDPSALISVLPTLLSAFGGGGTGGGNAGGNAAAGAAKPTGGNAAGSTAKSMPPDRHTALICAVKPYLGERRQATAETILKFSRVWDALNRAGITPTVLAGLLGGGNAPPAAPAGQIMPTDSRAAAEGEVH